MQEHMGSISKEMEFCKKEQKGNARNEKTPSQKLRMPLMSSLIIRAWPRKESVSLKKC